MISPDARGDWAALRTQLAPYLARRLGTSAEVDDVLQEVLLRLQRGAPTLRDDERFGAWVYQVTRHALVDHHRARRRLPFAPGEDLDALALPPEDDDPHATALLSRCLGAFIGRLAPSYREALTLTELEGLSQREAAARLGISVSGMKSRVQRGREKLRAMLLACCDIALDARGGVIDAAPRARTGCPCGPREARDPGEDPS